MSTGDGGDIQAPYEQYDHKINESNDGSTLTLRRQCTWLDDNAPTDNIPDALFGTGLGLCGGIKLDYKNRKPYFFKSDITDGISFKTLSAGLFMFCATVTSTVALGVVAYRETEGMIGITEYLMLQSVSGFLHSVFSCCPMAILRPTGPITAFVVDLYDLSDRFELNYYTLMSWVGLWVGLSLIVIAVFDLSRFIALCTRFLHDIYAVFVCTIYITDGVLGVTERFERVEWSQAFFASYLALFCVLFSLWFYYIDRSMIFTRHIRSTIADYAVPIAVVICVKMSFLVVDNVEVDRLQMPRNFETTYYDDQDGIKRSWFQGLGLFKKEAGDQNLKLTIFVALIASVPIAALFYIDHLFSCILAQKPELGLKKGEYYHSSMLITGICNCILPSFGLPFVTASLPHSPQFIKALTDFDKEKDPWKVLHVHESRIAPLFVYTLCFGGLVFPSVLELCPEGVMNGILAFVGIQGILPGTGNQFIDRIVLLFTAPSEMFLNNAPKNNIDEEEDSSSKNSVENKHQQAQAPYAHIHWTRIHLYTLFQLTCLAACWGMRFTGPFSLAFPLVIVGFVPLRLIILPKWFTEEELEALDSEGHPEQYDRKMSKVDHTRCSNTRHKGIYC